MHEDVMTEKLFLIGYRLAHRISKTKLRFFFIKFSYKMGHIKIQSCIRFGGDSDVHLGLVAILLKTIR